MSNSDQSLDIKEMVERVREGTDIVHVIGQHIDLDRHNKALCPFHQEKVPSFSVNPTGQYFYCFGCGTGGDVIRFLELYENRPFMKVLSDLAEPLGLSLSAMSSEEIERGKEDRLIKDILTATAEFYHRNLTQTARSYLTKKRGFTEETISGFRIGYAHDGLRDHLINECKFPMDLCLKAGVLKDIGEGSIRDYFYKRIIFPNLKRGRVVHLSGRCFDGQNPKYLHLPGKIRFLYNEDALSGKEVFITEGIPDCLSAVQIGYPAVAILGSSSFKEEFVPKFAHCETLNLCLDGDKAGEEGALKAGSLIGERARIIQLPQGLDLNDYLKDHSKEDFAGLVTSAKDIIKYELSFIPAETDKTELPQRLESIIRKLAQMEKAKAEAYLSYEIKSRFKLNTKDIEGYRDMVNKRRKEDTKFLISETAILDAPIKYTALFDGLIDIVEDGGSPAFLLKEGAQLFLSPQVERDGFLYVPPPKEQIPWLLPRGQEVINLYDAQEELSQRERDEALYDDILAYLKAISELPGEGYYDLLVAWVIHTYLLESVQYSPVICLFAVPERGKSRTGKGMINIAHRGIHVESLRDPYLVRVANNLQASIFFDVIDIWQKALKNGSEDILLHRFEKGATVPRVLYPDRGAHKDIVYFSIFGPTVIATNEAVDRILETRAVSINMPETRKRFENNVTPEMSLPLKERLITFRAEYLGEILPDIPKPASGRLGDILKPLQQIIRLVKPDRESCFLGLVEQLQEERKIEKADSLEAQILKVLVEHRDEVERSILPVKLITDAFNDGRPDKFRLTPQRIGRRLSAMGFKKGSTGAGASAIIWDDDAITRLMRTYGLREMPESSDMPEIPESPAGITGITGDTGLFRNPN